MLIIFYLFLQIIGLVCLLPLSKKIPLWFIAATGFIWGLLFWMFISLVTLFLGLPFTWLSVGLLLLPLLATALYFNFRNKTYLLNIRQWLIILSSLMGVILLSYLVTRSSYIYSTTDSFNYIYHGKILARSGLVPWTVSNFTKIGAFSSIIQMNSQLLPGDYLSGYQTILGVSLLAALFIGSWDQLKTEFSPLISAAIAGALVLLLGTNTFLNHLFYIHNNLPAAALLFISLYAFWQAYSSDNAEWSILGVIAITGFSFTRIEGPLYAAAILLLVVTLKSHTYSRTLSIVLPYTLINLLWHVFLLNNAIQNKQLSRANLMLIIGALTALLVLALVSRWIQSLMDILPVSIVTTLSLGLALAILIEPEHMILSLTHFWQNLINVYYWGWTWLLIPALLPIIMDNKDHPGNRLLLYSTAVYVLIVLLLVLARVPYRIGQTDSSNRLMLQILPVIIFSAASSSGKLRKWFSLDGSG